MGSAASNRLLAVDDKDVTGCAVQNRLMPATMTR
jgi:hypothetical protein